MTPISSINTTDHQDITQILLKVVLNTITLILTLSKIRNIYKMKEIFILYRQKVSEKETNLIPITHIYMTLLLIGYNYRINILGS